MTRRRAARTAFTILELLTTIALLVIVMGLMVSLARYVRTSSADRLTRALLVELDQALTMYSQHNAGAAPLEATIPSDVSETELADLMQRSNQDLVALLRQSLAARQPGAPDPSSAVLSGELTIRDAWGQPIGYLSQQHPLVGMAPKNRPFLFSAGPDGRYLTRQDNLYSYDQSRLDQLPGVPQPLDKANNATGGG